VHRGREGSRTSSDLLSLARGRKRLRLPALGLMRRFAHLSNANPKRFLHGELRCSLCRRDRLSATPDPGRVLSGPMDDAQTRQSKIRSIQEAVAHSFGLSAEELGQESKRRVVAVPRQIAMYLAKQMTDASLPEIGRQFGGRHQTTVMHPIAKIDAQRRTEPDLDRAISKLSKSLAQN
jgi:hypothetical protein